MANTHLFSARRLGLAVAGLVAAVGLVAGSGAPALADNGPFFKPDLHVTYAGKHQQGMDVVYTFHIRNIGSDDAYNVDITSSSTKISLNPGGENVATLQPGGGSVGKIAMDQTVTRQVVCHGSPGMVCTGATLSAHIAHDLNPADNKASGK